MSDNVLDNLKNSVIINIDNYKNDHLNDKIFVKYVIKYSEKGGARGFLSRNLHNLSILKESTSHLIFAEPEEDFNNILRPISYEKFDELIKVNPDFLVIDVGNFEGREETLHNLLKHIKENFKGKIFGKIMNSDHFVTSCKIGVDGIIMEVFGDCIDKDLIKEMCSHETLPIIVSLNGVSIEESKNLLNLGVHAFILGEDITNPNKVLNRL